MFRSVRRSPGTGGPISRPGTISPARFQLDGPFANGSWGTTLMPGGESRRWKICDVRPGASFIIEVPLDGAAMSFEWLFDAVSNHRTRITQRIVLVGRQCQGIREPSSSRFRLDPRRRHEEDRRRVGEGRALNAGQQYRMNSLFRAKDSDFHHRLVAVSRTDPWAITGRSVERHGNRARRAQSAGRTKRRRCGRMRARLPMAGSRSRRSSSRRASCGSRNWIRQCNHLDVGPLRDNIRLPQSGRSQLTSSLKHETSRSRP